MDHNPPRKFPSAHELNPRQPLEEKAMDEFNNERGIQTAHQLLKTNHFEGTCIEALAEKIGTDEALMSKILHYNIEEFTIDRLVKFLSTLYPGAKVKIEVA